MSKTAAPAPSVCAGRPEELPNLSAVREELPNLSAVREELPYLSAVREELPYLARMEARARTILNLITDNYHLP